MKERGMIQMNRIVALLFAGGLLLVVGCERKSEAEPTHATQLQDEQPLEPWESVDDAFKGCELG
jgi:hypothetical protein